jgi:hypothetical protein
MKLRILLENLATKQSCLNHKFVKRIIQNAKMSSQIKENLCYTNYDRSRLKIIGELFCFEEFKKKNAKI